MLVDVATVSTLSNLLDEPFHRQMVDSLQLLLSREPYKVCLLLTDTALFISTVSGKYLQTSVKIILFNIEYLKLRTNVIWVILTCRLH